MNESALREEICTLGRSIFERGLTHGSTGNISARCDDGWLLTPTGSNLGRLDPARLSKLDWQGKLLSGDSPSKENFSPLHRPVRIASPSSSIAARTRASVGRLNLESSPNQSSPSPKPSVRRPLDK